MDHVDVIGWSGTIAVLVAFGAGALGILSATTVPYQLLNIYASAAVMYLSVNRDFTERATLNFIWGAIGVVALVRILL